MKIKAIKSFIGKISMNIDDEKEIIDKKLAEDLIKAGHVIEIKANKVIEPVKEIVKEVEKKVVKEVEEKATKKNKNKK